MSEFEGTLQEAEQPSPSKWAVEAAKECADLIYSRLTSIGAHLKHGGDPTSEGAGMDVAAIIDRAISSALAEQAKVLGEATDALEYWNAAFANNGKESSLHSWNEGMKVARDKANAALTKLRSLKR